MGSAQACPIENRRVNEKVARVCSTLVIGVLAVIVWLPVAWAKWVAIGLLFDYAMRSFVGLGLSPLSTRSFLFVATDRNERVHYRARPPGGESLQ